MKILVCIKQVLESGTDIKIDESGKWVHYSDSSRFEINPYDNYAIEEAILIKEKFEDAHIDVITVGPDRTADVLRRALGMGADEAIHIIDKTDGYRPPAVTASWISAYAKDKKYDLILTGIMSEDEMNAQTGPMIAQIMDLPCATATIRQNISEDKKSITIEREIEGGERDQFDITLPCVLTIQTGINSPRYPALSKVLRAKKKTFDIIQSETLDMPVHTPKLNDIILPIKEAQGLFIEGNIENKADQLLKILASRSLL